MKKSIVMFFLTICFVISNLYAQSYRSISSVNFISNIGSDNEFLNWHNLDPIQDHVQGVSTEKAYQFLQGKTSHKIVVAIIDSGIDIEHEDLKDKIWTNSDEIASNGLDDDQNGYIDDLHGWNFIGGSDGRNISTETLELTRLYKRYTDLFDGKTVADLSPDQKTLYEEYLTVKTKYEAEYNEAKEEQEYSNTFYDNYIFVDQMLQGYFGKDDYTIDDLKAMEPENEMEENIKSFMLYVMEYGITLEDVKTYKEQSDKKLNLQLNTNFTPRAEIVGDNPLIIDGKPYGNNDVIGADAEHGTHVAGIVGATRQNNIGINGIADNIEIMVLRAVPDGDERDKDIAQAIRYAADNGANIINMSFGKSFSPEKELVDEAVKYAEAKGVLFIHAAGNDAQNNDVEQNYPTKNFIDGNIANNWITVGASSKDKGKNLAGSFSNYGKKSVDIFAPGVDIYSTLPNNKYDTRDGTSMASPVVTGVAALVWSYYPNLTVAELKQVLLMSALKYNRLRVYLPNDQPNKAKKIRFNKLSVTGGLINAYKAVQLAEQISNK